MDNMSMYLINACYLIDHLLRDPSLDPPPHGTVEFGMRNGRGHEHAWSGDHDGSLRDNGLKLLQRLVPKLLDHFFETAPLFRDRATRFHISRRE
eukprot:COSAG06_NODE_30591_length_536_cov_0.794050_2_plen_94_part_00